MKMAIIITVYKQPQLVEKLLRSMQHDGFHFYLHIDKKVNFKEYEYLFDLPNTFLIKKRVDIKWAGYSMVKTLLTGIKQVLASEIEYDFISHMSAQCFPIKPVQNIYDFFENNKGKNFLRCDPFPNEWWARPRRNEEYHLVEFKFKGRYKLGKILTAILPKRKLPFSFTLYGSYYGAYWTITQQAAAYLVQYFNDHPEIDRFFKYSWGTDEFLFNTLLMNSPFKETIINKNYRYIDWSNWATGDPHPKVLTIDDFEKLKTSDCFIARKFDLTVDNDIIEFIRNNLLI